MKKNFLILWSAGLFSTLVALPYILALQGDLLESLSAPLWQMIILSILQSALLLAISVFFGLRLSKAIGFTDFAFLKPGFFSISMVRRILVAAAPWGLAAALLIKGLDFFFLKHIPQLAIASAKIAVWKSVLVAFYGGVVEELLMRLFLVSLLAWLIAKIFKIKEAVKSSVIMWSAIILAAIIFGLGHLPATATIVEITPLVFIRAVLLNGIGGLIFGWLYWKKGLEYAIVAHFTADIFIHVVLLSLLK